MGKNRPSLKHVPGVALQDSLAPRHLLSNLGMDHFQISYGEYSTDSLAGQTH